MSPKYTGIYMEEARVIYKNSGYTKNSLVGYRRELQYLDP